MNSSVGYKRQMKLYAVSIFIIRQSLQCKEQKPTHKTLNTYIDTHFQSQTEAYTLCNNVINKFTEKTNLNTTAHET